METKIDKLIEIEIKFLQEDQLGVVTPVDIGWLICEVHKLRSHLETIKSITEGFKNE